MNGVAWRGAREYAGPGKIQSGPGSNTVRSTVLYNIAYCTVTPGKRDHSSFYTPQSITVMTQGWCSPWLGNLLYAARRLRSIQE